MFKQMKQYYAIKNESRTGFYAISLNSIKFPLIFLLRNTNG